MVKDDIVVVTIDPNIDYVDFAYIHKDDSFVIRLSVRKLCSSVQT